MLRRLVRVEKVTLESSKIKFKNVTDMNVKWLVIYMKLITDLDINSEVLEIIVNKYLDD